MLRLHERLHFIRTYKYIERTKFFRTRNDIILGCHTLKATSI